MLELGVNACPRLCLEDFESNYTLYSGEIFWLMLKGQQSCFRQITCFLRTEHEYILVACMIPSKSHCPFSQIPCAAGRLPRMPTFTCPMTVKRLSRAWLQVRPEMHSWGMRFWIARLAKSFRFVLNISCTDLQLHFSPSFSSKICVHWLSSSAMDFESNPLGRLRWTALTPKVLRSIMCRDLRYGFSKGWVVKFSDEKLLEMYEWTSWEGLKASFTWKKHRKLEFNWSVEDHVRWRAKNLILFHCWILHLWFCSQERCPCKASEEVHGSRNAKTYYQIELEEVRSESQEN